MLLTVKNPDSLSKFFLLYGLDSDGSNGHYVKLNGHRPHRTSYILKDWIIAVLLKKSFIFYIKKGEFVNKI